MDKIYATKELMVILETAMSGLRETGLAQKTPTQVEQQVIKDLTLLLERIKASSTPEVDTQDFKESLLKDFTAFNLHLLVGGLPLYCGKPMLDFGRKY